MTQRGFAQGNTGPLEPGTARVVEMEGVVEVQRAGATPWDPSRTNQVLYPGDHLRAGLHSRAALLLSDLRTLRLGELGHIQIPEAKRPGLNFFRGILYFFHRDKPGEFEFRTPTVSAVVRGTEFTLQVAEDETTTLLMFDGQVRMTNLLGQLDLKSGEGAVARRNQAPERTAMIEATNVIQWCLYYPAILDINELNLTSDEEKALGEPLAAYRQGDLLASLAKYPPGRQPASDREKVYLAALLLAVGQVDQADRTLNELDKLNDLNGRLAAALRKVVAVVKHQAVASTNNIPLSTSSEWLAESYQQQSQGSLDAALIAARRAVDKSPRFAFGWERVAELEFSFGRVGKALDALGKSLQLAPRNAEALALQGFLLSAQNKISEAISYFDRAIAIDGALGNAWLGRGLCRIRQGDANGGRKDLQVAATLEPQRAALRSYLAKAFSNDGDNRHALKEIERAKELDINDPTAWLYSALILQQESRINEAVRDLEESQELNENRRIYRSRLLLDQDRAVRGANLATIYQDAGMIDVSVREAARAVNLDYANYSAHLFLANSYNALRDPRQFNLRYETPAINEYLLANLLADVRAGTLSPSVTQQEYSKLFERDRFGVASSTEYFSRGDWIESGAMYGIFGNSSFVWDAFYDSFHGQRPNNDREDVNWSLKYKQQLTPQDSVYLQAVYGKTESGDLTPNYFNVGNPGLRVREVQDPILLAGYHREWSPGNHTLFLGARLDDSLRWNDPNYSALVVHENAGQISEIISVPLAQRYRSETEIYSAEIQQIFQREQQTVILGGRYQGGDLRTRNTNALSNSLFSFLFNPLASQDVRSDFQRLNFYGYYHLQLADPSLPLHFIGGVSYDRLTFPENFRFAPISHQQKTTDQVSPKVGVIWTPWKDTTLRAAWSRSLGGASIDQSFQLEPSQVAGFNQAWRSIIPEAVAGANAGATFENWGLALDQKFPTGTYAGVTAEVLKSKVDRVIGVLDLNAPAVLFPPFPPFNLANSGTPEKLDYQEQSVSVSLNQLLSRQWSLGARYRISAADLHQQFPLLLANVPLPTDFIPDQNLHATLNQVSLFAIFNHHTGFFSQFESLWFSQNNRGYAHNIPGDDFWQFNVFAGYRFPRRWVEITVGVQNLTDQDYHLNPLNLLAELPRGRTFFASLRFSF